MIVCVLMVGCVWMGIGSWYRFQMLLVVPRTAFYHSHMVGEHHCIHHVGMAKSNVPHCLSTLKADTMNLYSVFMDLCIEGRDSEVMDMVLLPLDQIQRRKEYLKDIIHHTLIQSHHHRLK